jgi:7,8-dihydroneopterin aldolase/epimerase/oxygenase
MKIRLNDIRLHAFHGCWEEEAIVGGEYSVDICVDFDYTDAALADDLSQTIDYVKIKEIVYREMAVRAKLIETVSLRILNVLKAEFPQADNRWVKITKINAPMGGQVHSVSVEIEG